VSARKGPYGLLAEFHSPEDVVGAAHVVHEAGYRRVDGYSPYPIEELAEALGVHYSPMPALVLAGGITGLLGGLALEYWASVIAYPLNIGGRPFASWVAFIPPAFETTILLAALTAVFGMLLINGLPQPYHPLFNVADFALASRDRFFLCVESADSRYDAAKTRAFLEGMRGVVAVHEVRP
jgi:hypothetical protein